MPTRLYTKQEDALRAGYFIYDEYGQKDVADRVDIVHEINLR
jgi:hypothetical protein